MDAIYGEKTATDINKHSQLKNEKKM